MLVLLKGDLDERQNEVAAKEQNVAMLERSLAQRLKAAAKPGLSTAPRPRLGRKELCWCKSGKNYKNCHLPKES